MLARLSTLTLVSLAALGAFTRSASPVPLALTAARTAEPGTLAVATERVIIFKDGYGLFVKSASAVADGEGKVHTDQVPGAAVLGTFWAIPEGRALKSTIADWYETVRAKTDEGSCLTTLELMRANKGKQVTFGLGDKELAGKLVDVLEAPALRTKIQPGAEGTYETELAFAPVRSPPAPSGSPSTSAATPRGSPSRSRSSISRRAFAGFPPTG